MRRATTLISALALLLLAGCSGGLISGGKTVPPVDVTQLPPMRVELFSVVVPETLTVSEENSYKPKSDIVWRGDPYGPRYAQVKAIFEAGIRDGVKDLSGSVPVNLHIVVQRFHSQTQKVRYTFGGQYEIEYDLQVSDARSGAILIPAYRVYAIEDAPGGSDAIVADDEGRTEKADNIALIAASIRTQLTGVEWSPVPPPEG